MAQIKSLTDEEVVKIILELYRKVGRYSAHRAHCRNVVVVLLMLDAGFRVSEVAKTRRGSLVFAGEFCDTVTVTEDAAKLGFKRTIPTTTRLKEAVKTMQREVWGPGETSLTDYAFFSGWKGGHLSVRQIQRIVANISVVAINRKIHPHMLRHTFATRLMRTVNIRVVQELLGHKSLTSTQIYTHPNGEDLKAAIGSLE